MLAIDWRRERGRPAPLKHLYRGCKQTLQLSSIIINWLHKVLLDYFNNDEAFLKKIHATRLMNTLKKKDFNPIKYI